jgi:hypothetical protein
VVFVLPLRLDRHFSLSTCLSNHTSRNLRSSYHSIITAYLPEYTTQKTMNLKTYLLALTAAAAAGISASVVTMEPRQENEDAMDLYLCSNPNFNHDCAGCACERMADLLTVGGYGAPPCCMSFSHCSLSTCFIPGALLPFYLSLLSLLYSRIWESF